jgi:hypothetical protein
MDGRCLLVLARPCRATEFLALWSAQTTSNQNTAHPDLIQPDHLTREQDGSDGRLFLEDLRFRADTDADADVRRI